MLNPVGQKMKKIIFFVMCLSVSAAVFAGGEKEESAAQADFERWEDVRPRLEDLPFDDFIDEAYRELAVRTPELVTELGLDEIWGCGGNLLNNMSDEYLTETARIERGILGLLEDYPVAGLSDSRLRCRAVVRWRLEDLLRLEEFRMSSFTVNHFTIAEPASTELFFSDVQPVESAADAENYIRRLGQVGTKMSRMADWMDVQREHGAVLPELSIRWTLGNVRKISLAPADSNLYYRTFASKVGRLGLDPGAEAELLERALAASGDSVIPGYARLEEALLAQREVAAGNRGAWSLPGGREFYRAALLHHTTTGMSPEEIRDRGYAELERIHGEMRVLFGRLGIDGGQSIAAMYRELDRRAEIIPAESVVERYSEILADAERISGGFFRNAPKARVVVKGAASGGFYMPASLDGTRPGVFFATETAGPRYRMPTLTFHETVPGHHFQLSLANELPISPWQKGNSFLGYVEGWALYAERLMADAGYYADDPAGDLGRLQAEAHRAARLVMDTGLNCFEWEFGRAVRFFVENTGMSEGYGSWEALRYIVWPGQASAYMTGLLAILDLRDDFRNAAGDGYDIRDFHSLILDGGAVPLSLLGQ